MEGREGTGNKRRVDERVYDGTGTRMFSQLGGFRNLLVWKRADDLADVVHQLTRGFWPGYFRLSDQMRGAAISEPANIAEGYGRGGLGDYVQEEPAPYERGAQLCPFPGKELDQ